jgi:hypothetical protein
MSSATDAEPATWTRTVFDTDQWLAAWAKATIDRQRILHPGRPPRYLLADSPFWRGYEDEVGSGKVWDRPVLTVGSVYSVFGPSFLLDDPAAVETLVDDARIEAADLDAAGVLVFNLPPAAAGQWAAIREPDAVVRLDHAYSKDPGVGADPVMGDVKKHARTEWRRRWRRATERGVQLVHEYAPTSEQIDKVVELTNGSAVKHDWPALYDKETFVAVLGVPGAHLILAEWEGRTIGAFVALEHDGRQYLWAGGTDPSVYAEVSPYLFLLYELMASGVERGINRIEFGRGNDEFKRRHGFTGVPLWSLWYAAKPGQAEIYRPRLSVLHDGLATVQGYDGLAQAV